MASLSVQTILDQKEAELQSLRQALLNARDEAQQLRDIRDKVRAATNDLRSSVWLQRSVVSNVEVKLWLDSLLDALSGRFR